MMRLAMAPLVFGCVAIGLLPATLAGPLGRAVRVAAPNMAQGAGLYAALEPVQTSALIFAAIAATGIAVLLAATRRAEIGMTWDCGYADPSPRMQYTSSSFARGLVGFFDWAMPADVHAPRAFALFPAAAKFESHVPDTVLDRALLPLLRAAKRVLELARYIQHGRLQLYLVYVGVALVVLLAWSAV